MIVERKVLNRVKLRLELGVFKLQSQVDAINNEIEQLLAQPEQEPVAWKVIDETNDGAFMFSEVKPMERYYKDYVVIPLYTAQQKREPLSDDEMIAIWKEGIRCEIPFVEIGRAIEKAHGIRGGE